MNALVQPAFSFKSPNLRECVTIILESQHKDRTSPTLIFRELISKVPELIVTTEDSPGLSAIRFRVVIKQTLYRLPIIQGIFKSVKCDVKAIIHTSLTDYQKCLQHTALFKLAPMWNVLGYYLIEGKPVPSNSDPANAVSNFEIITTYSETTLTFRGLSLKLTPMKKDHIGNSYCSENITCLILPELKEVIIDSITPELSKWGDFNCYEAIRDHWNKTFGYDLPENPGSDMFYVNAHFSDNPNKQYTYPRYCVLPHEPTVVPTLNMEHINQYFLNCFITRVGQICGEPLQLIDNEPPFPKRGLIGPSSEMTCLSRSDLSYAASCSKLNPNAAEFIPSVDDSIPVPVTESAEKVKLNSLVIRRSPIKRSENQKSNLSVESSIPVKKPRNVGCKLTIEELARRNKQLDEAKVVNLKAWLKTQGVTHNRNDKKSDLIDDVVEQFLPFKK